MGKINVLSKKTIDQIAAGEVVERPASVVKELVENAIDAGATAISVETKNGGIDLIRVTDNGSGIERDDIPTAFKAHATSKIREISDLESVLSLGFRGEALPSIASVSEMELLTKTHDDFVGTDYLVSGGEFVKEEEIGAPDGTTMIVRNLFFNTPARRKFLKTPMTENAYVGDLLEKFALSHPEIRFKWTANGAIRLSTNGNGRLTDLIYAIYGRETAAEVTEISYGSEGMKIRGFLGKPVLSKGNRGFENYFINGRYVKSKIIDKAIEDAYAPFMMQHRYPFCVLYIETDPSGYDVNVHPTKMELRFEREGTVYDTVFKAVSEGLQHREFIPDVTLSEENEPEKQEIYEAPEPFEQKRIEKETKTSPNALRDRIREKLQKTDEETLFTEETEKAPSEIVREVPPFSGKPDKPRENEQMTLPETFISQVEAKKYRLIGQLFKTYWLIEIGESLYILDQHAAHEKVLYERKMKAFREKKTATQYVSPPEVFTVTEQEELILNRYAEVFESLGFEIRYLGQKEYALSGVPSDLLGLEAKGMMNEVLSGLSVEYAALRPDTVTDRIASMSCKAAVKGNHALTEDEADALIGELLTLENPYACPHGRPTLISITKTELEKKFKRIV